MSYNLVASDFQDVEMVEKSAVATSSPVFSGYNSLRGSAPSFDDCSAKYSDDCKKKTVIGAAVFTVCAGLGFGLGFGYAPYTYRVYNRDSDSIYLHYRPGCSRKSGKNTIQVDCIKYVNSGDHAVIYSAGHLTKLCARDDWDSSWTQNCATYKGVQNDLTWNVHNHHGELYFGRGEHQNSTHRYLSSDLTPEFTQANLRGSIKK